MNQGRQVVHQRSAEIAPPNSREDASDLEQLFGSIEASRGIARRLGQPFLFYLLGMAAREAHSINERRKYLSSD